MTIYKTLIRSNKVLNTRHTSNTIRDKALKELNKCCQFMNKGYSLDCDMSAMLRRYIHVKDIPDAQDHRGKYITDLHMNLVMEAIYPIIPKHNGIIVIVQPVDNPIATFSTNIRNDIMVDVLRGVIDNLEQGQNIDLHSSN